MRALYHHVLEIKSVQVKASGDAIIYVTYATDKGDITTDTIRLQPVEGARFEFRDQVIEAEYPEVPA